MKRIRRSWPVAAALLLAVTAVAGCAPGGAGGDDHDPLLGVRPDALSVPAGVPITFVLVNEDPIDHEWLIGDEAFHEAHRTGTHASHDTVPTEVTVPALETVETTITFDEPGR